MSKTTEIPQSQVPAQAKSGWSARLAGLWRRFAQSILGLLPESLSPQALRENELLNQQWAISAAEREDLDFVGDSEAALRDAPSQGSLWFVVAIFALIMIFLTWAYFAQLEEVTRGDGRVIPSSRAQIVQSLEGGIVEEILVREGQTVTKDQVLLKIDDTGFSSNLGELKAKELSLKSQVARLKAESAEDGAEVDSVRFPAELMRDAPQVVANEKGLFEIRRNNLENQLNVLGERLEQKQRGLQKLQADAKGYAATLAIVEKRYARFAEAERRGALSATRVLEVEQQKADLERQLAATQQSIAGAQSAVKEANRLLEEQRLSFRQTAHSELNTKLAELAVVEQSLTAAEDRVTRADLRSPVEGIINKLHVNTVGGVVRASEPLVEITPLEDNLYVEVRVEPKDIAFISPGLPALVKISAYDFTVYGGLEGNVEVISSDSILDESTKESYYLVTVKTKNSSLRRGDQSLPIIPGMVATVDIITGEKSVLDYILKPIVKARYEALRER